MKHLNLKASISGIIFSLAVIMGGLLVVPSTALGITQIIKGPYLSQATEHSIVISWVTDQLGDSKVEFGLTSSYGSLEYDPTLTTNHSLTLTGLEISTTYHYRVSSQGALSPDHTFRTARRPDEPFTFVVLGDTQAGYEIQPKLLSFIRASSPDLLLHVGDLVDNGHKAGDWDIFFNTHGFLMAELSYYPVLGNHEYYYTTTCPLYFEFFALPGNERWYSFDYGNVHFIALDVNDDNVEQEGEQVYWYEAGTEQYNWLVNDLETHQSAEFTFVFFHQPPYSSKRHALTDGYAPTMRSNLCPLFERYGVDVVFNGHDHGYERSLVNGVNYIVTGGGGGRFYPMDTENDWSIFNLNVNHFCKISIDGSTAVVEAVDITGNVFDKLTIEHETEENILPIVIWPGDTNNDGTVNEVDILPIASYWLLTGPPRQAASFSWKEQTCSKWSVEGAAYADANGDGIIDEREVVVIGLNWGFTHGFFNAPKITSDGTLRAYQAIYQFLENSPENEAIKRIKDLLAILIEAEQVPGKIDLGQNYPNPFNPETWIPFSLSEPAEATIRIYSLAGQLVRTLYLGNLEAGKYMSQQRAAYWDGKDETGQEISSGVYLYQLSDGENILTKKMVVLN